MTGLFIILGLSLVAGWRYWPRIAAFLEARRREAEFEMARLIQEPVLICSQYPGDPDVKGRAARLRGLLVESGNTWISGADVIEKVYHPNMTYGKAVSMSFSVWYEAVHEEFQKTRARWIAQNQSFEQTILAQNGVN